jgi:hypothetical protein
MLVSTLQIKYMPVTLMFFVGTASASIEKQISTTIWLLNNNHKYGKNLADIPNIP